MLCVQINEFGAAILHNCSYFDLLINLLKWEKLVQSQRLISEISEN